MNKIPTINTNLQHPKAKTFNIKRKQQKPSTFKAKNLEPL